MMVGEGGEQGSGKAKEGQILLGAPTFREMDNGRLRCVETGHELPSRDMADSYGLSKGCRLALIDAALARKKPPLNMFKPDPLSKLKLICKLTGDTINKSEQHIWKHITGKRFQNKLKLKEEQMDVGASTSNEVAGMNIKNGKKTTGKVVADGHLGKNDKQLDKLSNLGNSTIRKNQKQDPSRNCPMSGTLVPGCSDSEEPDFWVPPIGSRWDFDNGMDRWESCSNSTLEKDQIVFDDNKDDACTADLSARTKRMSIAVGPGSFASRKKKSKKSTAD